MTLQEIQSLVNAGYTKADIDALSEASGATTINQDITAPQVVQTQAQAPTSGNDLIAALTALGAQLNAQTTQPQVQPQPVQPAQPQQVVAQTPSNSGITPEEATKLFQAWSAGAATQNIELPPTAEEVLTRRFASLYGADTTQKQTK